ncbi:MAG: hypothetical protein QXZ34_05145, partial [Candidatus Bathyarchaeia archaeon]
MNQKIFSPIFLGLFMLSLILPATLANTNDAIIFIRVEPSYKEIKAGEVARFSIKVESLTRFKQIAILTVEGLPENTVGILTPEKGIVPFQSKLTIITSIQTPTGVYEVTIVAISGEKREEAKVGLIIN